MALYDSIAAQYDATRGYPPAVAENIGQQLGELARQSHPDPLILEIGAGSGRVGLPVAASGVRYVGCDESAAMLGYFAAHLAAQLPTRATLLQADAKLLPFAAGSFDVGLAVHVFHLVGGWQRAADEFRRVVKSGGLLLLGFDIEDGGAPYAHALNAWNAILDAAGVAQHGQGRESIGAAVVDYLARQGASVQQRRLLDWQTQLSVAQMLHDHRYGGFCRTLTLPAADFDRHIVAWRDWLLGHYHSLDALLTRRQSFEVYILRLP